MSKQQSIVCGILVLLAASAMAQTNVTNSNNGTTGSVPVYTGASTVGNSPLSVLDSNVGIGTPNPLYKLEVDGVDGAWLTKFSTTNYAVGIYGGANGGSTGAQVLSMGNYPLMLGANGNTPLTILPGSGEGGATQNSGNVGIGTTTPVGTLSVTSADIGNMASVPVWNNSWSVFGPNSGNANGAALGLGYSATNGESVILSLAPNVAWKPLQIQSSATYLMGGNVGIGTTSPGALLEVNGSVKLTSGSGASITFQDGTVQSTAYTGVLCGGDFAESVDVTGKRAGYEPGDVLVIDPSAPGKFLKSAGQYSTAVLGIYSTKPGTVGRRQTTPKSPEEVPMAMVGIVPTKVSAENGAIRPGDLLVTASIPGYAMKGTDRSRMLGAVIGKALGGMDSGTGVIEVGVTLQ